MFICHWHNDLWVMGVYCECKVGPIGVPLQIMTGYIERTEKLSTVCEIGSCGEIQWTVMLIYKWVVVTSHYILKINETHIFHSYSTHRSLKVD